MATSFLGRWSKRKLEGDNKEPDVVGSDSSELAVETHDQDEQLVVSPDEENTIDVASTDEGEELSVAALLASEAEAAVKKAALRKLFLSGEFSEVDRLVDYDHDYAAVSSLPSEAAAKLREWLNTAEEESEESEAQLVDEETQLASVDTEAAEIDDSEQDLQVGQNIPHEN
ncbi:DUF3306 domain-containing protein [Vibrio hepatarius]|uniref:DUF3306 domain-containing protein n=1 Tax=Vibrio hepatarius TaxID=171383 RepID=UPI00142DEDA9|nr:DUF3306 domain-containing protein [Vibrio hepatarius]